jgi:hypothetical protein
VDKIDISAELNGEFSMAHKVLDIDLVDDAGFGWPPDGIGVTVSDGGVDVGGILHAGCGQIFHFVVGGGSGVVKPWAFLSGAASNFVMVGAFSEQMGRAS